MIPVETILQEYHDRRADRGELMQHMREAAAHFDGDVAIPLPEMDKDEKPAVANLMAQGLDQTAMRVASVMPSLEFPPVIFGRDKGVGSEDWARRRHHATLGWWQHSKIHRKMRRVARWVAGYACGTMMVRPDFQLGIPKYELRDPLSAYPALQAPFEDEQPQDFIYAFRKTYGWVEANYPDAARALARHMKRTPERGTVVELLEWSGPDERVLVLVGTRPRAGSGTQIWTPQGAADWPRTTAIEVMRTPNRTGICWGAQSNRITISRMQGQFEQVFGVYQNQATLMALESIAVKKAIFPDLVLQGTTPGRVPVLINGDWKDGRTGEINVVRDGVVTPIQLNPGFMTQPLMDRHERTIRQQGVPAQFSGEAPTGIATGRMGNQVLSASVDFPIQEYQEGLADLLHDLNVRAIAIAKAYFGDTQKSFSVSYNGTKGRADYKPSMHFETDEHHVRYSAPGADVNSLVIGIGQRVGLGTMSTTTAMKQDPMIPDPMEERRLVTSERIQESLLNYVAQAAESGQLDPQDIVLIAEAVEKGETLAAAWTAAQAAAQKRQAEAQAQQQEAAQQQDPNAPPDPALQPGLSPPGDPQEAGLAIRGPNPNQQNLAQMLGALRQPSMITGPMAGRGNAPNVPVGG